MTNYIALLRKDDSSDYGVEFPDFPGCITAGRTLDEAKDMAAEALALHVDGLIDDGEGLPTPSGLDTIMANPDNANSVAFLVSTPARTEKAVRVNVTFAESVLHRIDAAARSVHLTRSAFLADAALKAMREGEQVD
ncbi:MAG: type II toxin-antitoxin system HicB family antitoxin [Proteobacteria bacterium]|nr:type II toxin-antitoxin system HicB family antitoxin [Pseudomonadota bacterium]